MQCKVMLPYYYVIGKSSIGAFVVVSLLRTLLGSRMKLCTGWHSWSRRTDCPMSKWTEGRADLVTHG